MLKVAIVGASGYTGATLAKLIANHPSLALAGCYVSAGSADAHTPLSQLYPELLGLVDQPLQPLTHEALAQLGQQAQAVCLATDHQVSAELAPALLAQGLTVFDLSGGHRFADPTIYPQHYGFSHPSPELLSDAVYGLAEWAGPALADAALIAVPGCYPTAALTALKPLAQHGLIAGVPVINAVSGVSGAGRKASLNSSFCEVSLTPYGVLGHRHQPEIESQLGHAVVFTPHLGAFKRGILATITVPVNADCTEGALSEAYGCYDDSAVVHCLPAGQWPKVDDVAGSDRCLLAWKLDSERQVLVVASAIDNLMKGAASQALQCILIRFGLGGEA
ncbi:N-acetyl-gamma-glutamyl-phosphate reductase [Ferrimonas balearica]|uniref:N-acetyl-gamma-glutamyl-phosphate reductase n=1 Tax=Ferrimonas balearica TaxID=44012 RepID=UPI001C581E4C|nr:N-acetyl-gamma-glutamyl-phosphate reductase [Ferrimonas balearica]MBW3140337.1 N-acetyl-gamma-glutamyl-phosphate reductase [Ferrimonas balearica]